MGTQAGEREGVRVLGALAALCLATFAYVTTESIPVGLLPQLSHSLHHSRSATGYLVTGYAAVVVVGSVPLALVTRRYSRRLLLLASLAVFVVGAAAGAAAQSYTVLLATRMAIAVSHCVFWAVIAATGAALVPPERRGRALGIVFAGASLASVVGVPGVTWLGQQTSWRVSTLAASGLGLVALAAIYALVPAVPAESERDATARHASRVRYAFTISALGFAIVGAFALLTYITVFLSTLGGLPNSAISPVLLGSGATGAIGVYAASHFTTEHARATMAAGVAGLAVVLLALAAFARHGVADVVLFCCFGFALSTLAVGVQARVLDTAPGNINVASAGNSAMFNVGIGGGALLGGLLLEGPGVRSIALVGGLVSSAALAALLAERWLVD
ncbi:MAG TPA: MFS transporter [Gaiellaceae bacterium]|nr:MFS transporter [Gaiellaceae bacterium]